LFLIEFFNKKQTRLTFSIPIKELSNGLLSPITYDLSNNVQKTLPSINILGVDNKIFDNFIYKVRQTNDSNIRISQNLFFNLILLENINPLFNTIISKYDLFCNPNNIINQFKNNPILNNLNIVNNSNNIKTIFNMLILFIDICKDTIYIVENTINTKFLNNNFINNIYSDNIIDMSNNTYSDIYNEDYKSISKIYELITESENNLNTQLLLITDTDLSNNIVSDRYNKIKQILTILPNIRSGMQQLTDISSNYINTLNNIKIFKNVNIPIIKKKFDQIFNILNMETTPSKDIETFNNITKNTFDNSYYFSSTNILLFLLIITFIFLFYSNKALYS
jgi:hypothetical protein